MLNCRGIGADIEAGDSGITIKPRGLSGLLLRGATGSKFIAYSKISAVQLKAPGITSGFIQFTLSGGTEKTKGIFEATSDENSVVFTAAHLQDFEKLRALIIERTAGTPAPSAVAPHSMATELANLADLRSRGLLTDQEFAAAKASLLGPSANAQTVPSPVREISAVPHDEDDTLSAEFLGRVDAEIERQKSSRPVSPIRTFGKRGG